mmetsp:Transcript_15923/g.32903  ORF Transcript_15923/g.32903 Transcript_15923/m.32903 type:complete len:137 (+) Transcript_15923:305-715(+)
MKAARFAPKSDPSTRTSSSRMTKFDPVMDTVVPAEYQNAAFDVSLFVDAVIDAFDAFDVIDLVDPFLAAPFFVVVLIIERLDPGDKLPLVPRVSTVISSELRSLFNEPCELIRFIFKLDTEPALLCEPREPLPIED